MTTGQGAVVGLFMLVVGPGMKVDPEEMSEMREQMKDTPLSFLMGSGTAAAKEEQPTLAAAAPRRGAAATSRGTAGGSGAARKKR